MMKERRREAPGAEERHGNPLSERHARLWRQLKELSLPRRGRGQREPADGTPLGNSSGATVKDGRAQRRFTSQRIRRE